MTKESKLPQGGPRNISDMMEIDRLKQFETSFLAVVQLLRENGFDDRGDGSLKDDVLDFIKSKAAEATRAMLLVEALERIKNIQTSIVLRKNFHSNEQRLMTIFGIVTEAIARYNNPATKEEYNQFIQSKNK